jgi:CMP/dCMP kinase
MIIAIDGPSGTGKSTVAREVARRLGFTFFDTGAMYRSFAWKVCQSGIDPADEAKVIETVPSFHFQIGANKAGDRAYFVDGVDVTSSIRTREISNISSKVAAYGKVRSAMVKMQRRFGRSCNAVFEGRDMGTVVFPDADLKIFLTAKPTVRAERRYRELIAKLPNPSGQISIDEVLKEISQRDKNDSSRSVSPLIQAEDAILIDTSDLSIDQVVDQIVRLKPKSKTRFSSMKFSYWIVYSLARLFFKVFFRLKIYGEKHVQTGPGLLIANHTSFYDPPVLSISCLEEVHFLARESLFRIPLLGSLIKVLNTHPVARDASDIHVLRQMIRLLGEGNKLIIFPEGKRSEDGKMKPFERGFVFLAKKAKCTVYPAYIDGAYLAWPQHKKFPKLFGKITCVFGSPIFWEDFEDLPKDIVEEKFSLRCSSAISNLKVWLQKGAIGEPP